eukprot:m.27679 g.27679  ORF g.27679 m.27679 type:complete len:56 (-) comp8963_c0_seq1:266-433(-)
MVPFQPVFGAQNVSDLMTVITTTSCTRLLGRPFSSRNSNYFFAAVNQHVSGPPKG